MKTIKSSLLIMLILQGSLLTAQQVKYKMDTTRNGDPMLYGEITPEAFNQAPFSEWFTKNTEAYQVDIATLSGKVQKLLSKFEITIYMGTWCGDSRKEVPAVIKTLESAGYDMTRLKIVALNQSKQAHNREEVGKNIHRVPTIIFSKNGKEKGRIVEHPVATIEQDIQQILTTHKYQPNYYGLEVLHKTISKNGFEVLQDEKFIQKIKPLIHRDYELYKYGVIYFRNQEYDKALAIYDFNAQIFPTSDRPYQNKGISYYMMGDLNKAKSNLKKALQLNPENKYAKKYMAIISEEKVSSTK